MPVGRARGDLTPFRRQARMPTSILFLIGVVLSISRDAPISRGEQGVDAMRARHALAAEFWEAGVCMTP